jgi:hypothetical protein
MNMKQTFVGILTTGCLIGAAALLPSAGQAQDAKVKIAMELLQSMAGKMGPPKTEGTDTVAGKQVPAIYFGSTKMNNNFDLVDEIVRQVKKDDGSRAVGTILDPKGKAIASIQRNEPFYGEVEILGKSYITGYDPIRDRSNNVIGIYYVGYLK